MSEPVIKCEAVYKIFGEIPKKIVKATIAMFAAKTLNKNG